MRGVSYVCQHKTEVRTALHYYLMLFTHASDALKLVTVSVQLELISLARDLNLLLCLHQCHYTSASCIHSVMRLYEIF